MTTQGLERWLTEEPDATADDDVIADGKVKSRMLLCVDDSALARIIDRAVSTRVAWEAIRAEYEAQHELRQPLLVRQLNAVRQGSSEAYGDYAERVYEFMEKLAETDIDDADQLRSQRPQPRVEDLWRERLVGIGAHGGGSFRIQQRC